MDGNIRWPRQAMRKALPTHASQCWEAKVWLGGKTSDEGRKFVGLQLGKSGPGRRRPKRKVLWYLRGCQGSLGHLIMQPPIEPRLLLRARKILHRAQNGIWDIAGAVSQRHLSYAVNVSLFSCQNRNASDVSFVNLPRFLWLSSWASGKWLMIVEARLGKLLLDQFIYSVHSIHTVHGPATGGTHSKGLSLEK